MKPLIPRVTQLSPSSRKPQPAMAYTARTASAEVLTTLAVLKVQVGQGQDYLQNFIPFVAECLRINPSDVVSVQTLQAGFKKLFGFVVPGGVLQTLLKRAAKQGLVQLDNRVYRPVREQLNTLTIENDREQAGQELDSLTNDFQQFAAHNYEQALSLLDAENALFEFISEHGVFSLVDGGARMGASSSFQSASTHFLVGAFVEQLIANNAQSLGYFERAVQGSMLASVLHFENKVTVTERWKDAAVYFDTPILLRIIGLYGEEVKAPYLELVQLLTKQHVAMHCFQHTLSEVDRVLYSIEENLRQGRRELKVFEDLGEGLLSSNWSAGDVRTERGRVERKLLALGITPHELPRVQAHLNPDMNRANEVFQQAVGYRNENARDHDVAAVLAIHRLRGGLRPTQIERCVAVFVTNNNKVVNATREAFKELFGYRTEDVNACISSDALTTIAWLKTNALLGVQGTLPRKQLVADAYAAMKPTGELWGAYLSEIQKLRQDDMVSEADVTYLRCAPEAASALARLTLNDPTAFVEGTVEQVLEQARAANRFDAETAQKATAQALAIAEAERSRLAEQNDAALQQVALNQQLVVQQVTQQEEAQRQLAEQNIKLAAKDASLAKYEAHLNGRMRLAHRVGVGAGWLAFGGALSGLSYMTWTFGLSSSVPAELQHSFTVKNIPLQPVALFLLFGIYSFVGLIPQAKDIRLKCEHWVQRLMNRILVGRFTD